MKKKQYLSDQTFIESKDGLTQWELESKREFMAMVVPKTQEQAKLYLMGEGNLEDYEGEIPKWFWDLPLK